MAAWFAHCTSASQANQFSSLNQTLACSCTAYRRWCAFQRFFHSPFWGFWTLLSTDWMHAPS